MKISVFNEILQNVTDRSDTPRNDTFRLIFMKKRQFCTFPLGLDRGLGQKCQTVLPWCPVVVSWCQNCQFSQKPLGLDRGFSRND